MNLTLALKMAKHLDAQRAAERKARAGAPSAWSRLAALWARRTTHPLPGALPTATASATSAPR